MLRLPQLVGLEPGHDMSRDCCKLIILPIKVGRGIKGIRYKRVLTLTLFWAHLRCAGL